MSFLGLCLASKLKKKEIECDYLKSRNDILTSSNRQLSGDVKDFKKEAEDLRADVERLKKEVSSKDGIIIQYGEEASDLRGQLKDMETKASMASDNFKVLSDKYNRAINSLKGFESNMAKAEKVIRFMYESLQAEDKPEMAEELNKRFGIVFAVPQDAVSNSEKEENGEQVEVEPENTGNNEDGNKVTHDEGGQEEGSGEQPVDEIPEKKDCEHEDCEHPEGGCGKQDCCKKKKNGSKKKKR